MLCRAHSKCLGLGFRIRLQCQSFLMFCICKLFMTPGSNPCSGTSCIKVWNKHGPRNNSSLTAAGALSQLQPQPVALLINMTRDGPGPTCSLNKRSHPNETESHLNSWAQRRKQRAAVPSNQKETCVDAQDRTGAGTTWFEPKAASLDGAT